MRTHKAIRSRVEKGAKWLDETEPGWEGRINLGELLISDVQQCVCGQVFLKYLEEETWSESGYDFAQHQQGFSPGVMGFETLNWKNCNAEYGALGDAWVELIKERYDSGMLSGQE